MTRLDYETYGGKEIFLSYEDEDETLFGLLRLRISKGVQKSSVEEALVASHNSGEDEPLPYNILIPRVNKDSALIRELHIFGSEVPLGEKRAQAPQHQGLGGKLLTEAERIAREEFRIGQMSILSGIGARDYYRSFGYRLSGAYMVKNLKAV